MSPEAESAETLLRVRKERLHSTMLVEILALLVFLAMGFALVSRDELAAQPLADKADRLERLLAERDQQIRELEVRVRGLELANQQLAQSLRRFAGQSKGTLRANDRVVVLPQDQFQSLTTDLANKSSMIDERQRENARLRGQLAAAGKGGTDLPNCTVTPGFLVSVDLEGNGTFLVRPMWAGTAENAVRQVSGVTQLASSRSLGKAEFQRLAQRVQDWGRSRSVPCGFRARVKPKHGNLDSYLQQHRVVARYFYTAW